MGDEAAARGRYGYWFPLVLLGFALLGLLGWGSVGADEDFGWFAYAPLESDSIFTSQEAYRPRGDVQLEDHSTSLLKVDAQRYPLRDWPWAVLVAGTLVATVAWYGRRARRAGGSVRTYVMVAVGGGVAVLLAYAAGGLADAIPDPAGLVTSVGLPLVVLGALAGTWAYLRLGPWQRQAAMISVLCLMTGAGTVLGAWAPGLLDPVIIAGGLLALARFERSRLLAAVAVAVLATMAVYPVGTLSMLVPAMIVLAAGIVALVRQGRTAGLT